MICSVGLALNVSADTLEQNPGTHEIAMEAEVSATSEVTITPSDDFVLIGESVQYSCSGAPGTVTWQIRDTNIATVNGTGLVTGVSQGQTYLTAMWDGGSLSVTIKVGALKEGTYYIGNKGSTLYMDLEGAASTDGTPIQQWQFHGGIQSRWIIAMESTGFYSIRCAYTGKYIGVENSSTGSNAAILQYSSIANQRGRQWYISVTSSGAYRFTPRSASNMALAVPLSGTFDNGTDLVQLVYTDNTNYRDEWVVIENGITTFLAIPDTGHDHQASFPSAITSVNAMGYGENHIYTSANTNSCIEMIASSDIFYSRSHGAQTHISLATGSFGVRNLNSQVPNDKFSKCKLVLFGACSTGQGRALEENLVNAVQAKGAKTVIGFESTVNCSEMNDWAKAFFAALAQKDTVRAACRAADAVISEEYPSTTTVGYWYIAGIQTQIIHLDTIGGN